VDETYERLFTLAHRLGAGAKLPTVRALREEMGISQSTLDAALDRLEGRQVLFRRQGSGIYVSPALRRKNVALVCNPFSFLQSGGSPFWGLLVEHIRRLAASNEAELTLHFARLPEGAVDDVARTLAYRDPSPLPESLARDIAEGRVHGVIAVGIPHPVSRWVESNGVPVVAFAGPAGYIVGMSYPRMIQIGVAELARRGCRRVEMWTPPDRVGREGSEIFLGALAAHGLTEPQEFGDTPPASPDAPPAVSAAEEGFRRGLARFAPGADPPPPEGVVSVDDMMTQGLLMALYRLGLRAGRDVQIATHANVGSAALLAWQGELIEMEYDLSELVSALFSTLEALMDGRTPDWASNAERLPELHYRLAPRLRRPEGSDS
jgi:DNA-binding LacI/PurR family transcriptional regulator